MTETYSADVDVDVLFRFFCSEVISSYLKMSEVTQRGKNLGKLENLQILSHQGTVLAKELKEPQYYRKLNVIF